jgi:hypothetical protein
VLGDVERAEVEPGAVDFGLRLSSSSIACCDSLASSVEVTPLAT